MIQITVEGRRASVADKELLTSGSAGIQVQFTLDSVWETAPSRYAVFRVGDDGLKIDVPLGNSLICDVPPEVLETAEEVVFIGVYGARSDGTVIIPTIWASAGVVRPGVEPATPRDYQPTPSVVDNTLEIANRAEQTATDAMSMVEEGLQDLSDLEGAVETTEAQRVAAEQSRVTAEQQRADAENTREAAEDTRDVNETARASAEADRVTAEAGRVSAENARATAEASRVTAEEGRVAAEAYREEKYAEYVTTVQGYADAASASASAAAGSASSASGSASAASTSAGQASSSATAASTSASQASSSASSASASATIASNAATTATTQAGIATTKAGEAATSATTASSSATSAAAAQAEAEMAQSAAEAAAEYIEESAAQIAQNTQDISDVKNAISQLDGGAEGQLLRKRSNTDYDFEWSDVGQPTDEQVDAAVTDWLDDHPEATTTVQDWSLTANKLVKGTLGFVTPQMFGAVADGQTDDSQAIKDAIDYAMANNYIVYIPSGTYGVSPGIIHINFTGNDSCIIIGDGMQSCIKRLDNSLHNRFDILITCDNLTATSDSNELKIIGLFMDSNRRGQDVDISGGAYEASHEICVRFHNANDYALRSAIFEDLYFYDGIADHLGFSSSNKVMVHNIKIDGFYAWGRNDDSSRNDIDFPGYPIGNTFIHNVSCQDIHIEFNSVPTKEVPFYMSDINCRHFTVGGGNYSVYVENLQMAGALIVHRAVNAYFTRCKFYLNANSYIANPSGVSNVKFIACDFVLTDNNGTSRFLNIEHYLDIEFLHCSFDYDGEDGTTYPVQGYPIRAPMVRNPIYTRKLKLVDCQISSKFDTGLYLYSCGDVFISDMRFSNRYPVFFVGTEGRMDVYFNNVDVVSADGYLFRSASALANEIYIHGDISANTGNIKPLLGASSFLENAVFDWTCNVNISTAPTSSELRDIFGVSNVLILIAGTELNYVGANRQYNPAKFVLTKTGYFRSLDNCVLTVGQGYGATGDRPTCYLSPGFRFFDTTLSKEIVWNGTTWVNCDGTALN